MNGKKVLGFLVMKPAWSSRNLTSLALVALFFGVYVAAGGKITAVPKVKQGSGFGSIGGTGTSSEEAMNDDETTSDAAVDREVVVPAARNKGDEKRPLSLQNEEFSLKPKRVDERPIARSPEPEAGPEPKKAGEPIDDLSDIEARLNIGRKGK